MSSPDIYTLQDMMEDYEDSPLDDALYHNYKNTSVIASSYERDRTIEVMIDGGDIVPVDTIQNHAQQVSDIVEQLGVGRSQFVGIMGGSDFRVTLVFKY